LANEEWRQVAGTAYEVSSAGRVRRGARVIKSRPHTRGYRIVDISTGGRPVSRTVHSLVAWAFHGDRPDGMAVDHIDGDKTHNCAGNLRYVTAGDNNRLRSSRRSAVQSRPPAQETHAQRLHRYRRAFRGVIEMFGREYDRALKAVRS